MSDTTELKTMDNRYYIVRDQTLSFILPSKTIKSASFTTTLIAVLIKALVSYLAPTRNGCSSSSANYSSRYLSPIFRNFNLGALSFACPPNYSDDGNGNCQSVRQNPVNQFTAYRTCGQRNAYIFTIRNAFVSVGQSFKLSLGQQSSNPPGRRL